MSIQHDEANKLAKLWKGNECHHRWEKEYYLATQTGDYRCSVCGDCISEEIYMQKRQYEREDGEK